MNVQCLRCKGRGFCGREACPHIINSEARFKISKNIEKQDFVGSSPSCFVGRVGYPKLHVGILSPVEVTQDAWLYDAPRYWAHNNMGIPNIVDYRSSLINSRFVVHAHDSHKMLDIAQEVGMASAPVDVEVNLEEKPKFRLNPDSVVAPTGPNANIKNAKITSNPKIHTKVDKVVSDFDLKANDALLYLYKNKFDENFLSKILSVGTLGVKNNRKLVPTRWSIASVDSTIGNHLTEKIKEYSQIGFFAYFGGYLGNYYLILFFPEVYSYELFETYMPKASWNISSQINYTTDYEPYQGRTSYAENCAGGFYASRIAILEKLENIKKQGSVLCLRFITGEYSIPLGVWVVREATRKALENKPLEFASKELMLRYAELLIKKKFNFDLNKIIKDSVILKNMKEQSKLDQFL
jgi:hypothetical protein